MRVMVIAAFGAAALAGCGQRSIRVDKEDSSDGPMRVVTQLECPEHQGVLTRVSTAADGLSCDYAGPRGAAVTLRLVKLAQGQTAEEALKPIEAQLNTLMPGVEAKLDKSDGSAKADPAAEADAAASRADAAEDAADRADAGDTAADRDNNRR